MNSAGGSIYKVVLSHNAERYLGRLDRKTQKRIVFALRRLASNPLDNQLDIKPLRGRAGEYRLRIGPYRIIYTLQRDVLLVYVVYIGTRGDVYK
ncbi:MAG: type II toxin-antitoxin system RelE family toxin [Desulfurispora sp.]|uniref:type II toxin-antitoxin system RelE family toxin n=1 Tax=Desulfurispora sp. TaxID=3014275 RepID=UPI00404B4A69